MRRPRFSQLPFKATCKRPVPVTDTFFCVPRLLAHESFRCTSAAEVLIALSSVTFYCTCLSLPADVLWGLFVTHSFLPHGPWGRNECATNEPQRTSAGRLHLSWLLVDGKTFLAPSCLTLDQTKPIFQAENIEEEGWRWGNLLPGGQSFSLIIWNGREKALGRRNRNLISIRTCFWCRMMTPLQGWVQIRRKEFEE